MATSNTVHTIGGVNLDKDPRAFQPNELSHAKDNDVFGDICKLLIGVAISFWSKFKLT